MSGVAVSLWNQAEKSLWQKSCDDHILVLSALHGEEKVKENLAQQGDVFMLANKAAQDGLAEAANVVNAPMSPHKALTPMMELANFFREDQSWVFNFCEFINETKATESPLRLTPTYLAYQGRVLDFLKSEKLNIAGSCPLEKLTSFLACCLVRVFPQNWCTFVHLVKLAATTGKHPEKDGQDASVEEISRGIFETADQIGKFANMKLGFFTQAMSTFAAGDSH